MAADVVRRHLSFEDLSATLTDTLAKMQSTEYSDQEVKPKAGPALATGVQGLTTQMADIARALQEAHGTMQQRVDDNRKAALEQLEATGGKNALESHLKAQKATWKFIGQKEAFLERIKGMQGTSELLQHDFSNDIAIADKAVTTLKEEIRERQAAIEKAEQQLGGVIQQVVRLYESNNASAGQLAQQLPRMAAELHEYCSGREQPPDATAGGMDEAELQRLVAEEEARAALLEQRAAREAAEWGAQEAEYAALGARVAELTAEVAAAEEACSAAAQQQGAKYSEQLQWLESMATALTRLTGVELSGHSDTTLHLTLTQSIPRGMRPEAGGQAGSQRASQDRLATTGTTSQAPGAAAGPLSQRGDATQGTQGSDMVLCGGGGSVPFPSQAGGSSLLSSLSQRPKPSAANPAAPGGSGPGGPGASQGGLGGGATQEAEEGYVVVESVLTLEFQPGSQGAVLRDAVLSSMPELDIGPDVVAAKEAQQRGGGGAAGAGAGRALAGTGDAERVGALAGLLQDVKARIRRHCRRQLLLEDAQEAYPLQPTSDCPDVLRCALPSKVEVEVRVPASWPDHAGASDLRLEQLQAPRSSQDLSPLLARLQAELEAAAALERRGAGAGAGEGVEEQQARQLGPRVLSLRGLLDWVDQRLVAEQRK